MVKVSVVIPVYDVEEYLEDCLESVLKQTLDDIEIICINDGSTDKSYEILERYAQKDKRMTVISQKNSGHAVATNKGITMATGEYLFLMDSDDTMEYNLLELTYDKAIKTGVDFVLFKALNYNSQDNEYYETQSYSMEDLEERVQDEIFNYDTVEDLIFTISVTPWSKLYKREFITDNHIMFPEGLIFDDNIFFWEALFNAKKIVFLNEFLFTRRYYSTSSTNNGDLRFLDSIEINRLIWETFKKYDHFNEHKNSLYNYRISSAYNRYVGIKEEYKNTFFNEMKKSFMELLSDEKLYDDILENLTDKNRDIFLQVLSTDTRNDFELLRNIYSSIQKNMGE